LGSQDYPFIFTSQLINKQMKNVDEVIKVLLENLEYAYKLKFEGENEEQDLGSLLDGLKEQLN
jgi:hypothetical protein